jgi:hypothetical protein
MMQHVEGKLHAEPVVKLCYGTVLLWHCLRA